MRALRITLSIARSNPQIIREFWIGADHTFEELQTLIQIVLNWQSKECGLFELDGQKIDLKETLGTHLSPEKTLHFSYPSSKVWLILLRVTADEADYTSREPMVTRFRTENPPQTTGSMKDLNHFLQTANDRYTYYYQNPRLVDQQKNKFSTKKVNRRLLDVFHPGEQPDLAELDDEVLQNIRYPLADMINFLTLKTLQQMLQNAKLSISFSQNKHQMIKNVVAYYNRPVFWISILEEMPFEEYKRFRDICTGQQPPISGKRLKVFDKYMLTGHRGNDTIVIANEFLDFYADWINAGNEKKYIEKKRIETAIIAGCRLYGALTKEEAKRLLDACYPRQWDPSLFDSVWKEFGENPDHMQLFSIAKGRDFYYDSSKLIPSDAFLIYQSKPAWPFQPYTPGDPLALEQYASDGLDFEGQAAEAILHCLQHSFSLPEYLAHMYSREIYALMHFGDNISNIISYICKMTYIKASSANARRLTELLKSLRSSVRTIEYMGYTSDEYALLLATSDMKHFDVDDFTQKPIKKDAKIYPNSPCPCGSGKKYKMCCGKKA